MHQGLSVRIAGVPRRWSQLSQATRLVGELAGLGWATSVTAQEPLDNESHPIPWMTYGAVHWLSRALRPEDRLLEWGSGNSTIWFDQRVRSVVAIEHDNRWATQVGHRCSAGTKVITIETHVNTDEDFAHPSDQYVSVPSVEAGSVDIAIVDGMARNSCIAEALKKVRAGGLVLLDDAERPAYTPGVALLARAGLGRIDFWGPKPGVGYLAVTSVFSTDLNFWAERVASDPMIQPSQELGKA